MRKLGHSLAESLEHSGSSECRLTSSRLTLNNDVLEEMSLRRSRICSGLCRSGNWAFFQEKTALRAVICPWEETDFGRSALLSRNSIRNRAEGDRSSS